MPGKNAPASNNTPTPPPAAGNTPVVGDSQGTNQPPAILLMGPTASGKTAVAVELVRQLNCEIISVDSAQVYRDMDIGTAKPDAALLASAPHHLINLINPDEADPGGALPR